MVTEKEHEQAQKEFFNKVCYEWNKTFDSKREEQDRLVAEIGLKGNERILDVATGIGVMVPSYLKYLKGGSIKAIDYSENMIAVAKERFVPDKYPNVTFEVRQPVRPEGRGRVRSGGMLFMSAPLLRPRPCHRGYGQIHEGRRTPGRMQPEIPPHVQGSRERGS